MALVTEAPSTQADAESRSQLLVVDRVSKHFGGIRAVNEASLTVGACQIAGIIGPASRTKIDAAINDMNGS